MDYNALYYLYGDEFDMQHVRIDIVGTNAVKRFGYIQLKITSWTPAREKASAVSMDEATLIDTEGQRESWIKTSGFLKVSIIQRHPLNFGVCYVEMPAI